MEVSNRSQTRGSAMNPHQKSNYNNVNKKPLKERNFMTEISPSGSMKRFDSHLPGEATPTKPHTKKIDDARHVLAQNQERLKNLERLLATVRDECDTVEKKKVRGFPTPQKGKKKATDQVQLFESTSTPTVLTPIQKFLEDEESGLNPMNRTPASVQSIEAWRGSSPDEFFTPAERGLQPIDQQGTPSSARRVKVKQQSDKTRPDSPMNIVDGADSDDADTEALTTTATKPTEARQRAIKRASMIYEADPKKTALEYLSLDVSVAPTDEEYIKVTDTPKVMKSAEFLSIDTPKGISAQYYQVVQTPQKNQSNNVDGQKLPRKQDIIFGNASQFDTPPRKNGDHQYMQVQNSPCKEVEAEYVECDDQPADTAQYLSIDQMTKANPEFAEYMAIAPSSTVKRNPLQDPDKFEYMQVLDTPKDEQYIQVVSGMGNVTREENVNNDSTYQYMQVLGTPTKDAEYLTVMSPAERRAKGNSFYGFKKVIGGVSRLTPDMPENDRPVVTPDLEMIASNFPSHKPPAVIHIEAAKGNLKKVTSLVVKGADIDTPDSHGRTPIMYALRFGQLLTARWLLEHGANINKQTNDKSTALHYAAFTSTEDVVRFLIQARASLDLTDDEGRTVLHWSCNNPNVRILEILLQESSVFRLLDVRDKSGMSPAMWACFYNKPAHLDCILAHEAALRELYRQQQGTSKAKQSRPTWESQRDTEGKTALHWSVTRGGTTCLKKLLTYESSFLMDHNGRSVIHSAAESGNKAAIKYIASKRPQAVHDVDNNGRTPLHWAAACHHLIAMRTLIKLGSYIKRPDVHGKTALDYCLEHEFEPGITYLQEAQECDMQSKPRMGPAAASTSLRAFQIVVPPGAIPPSDAARKLFKTLSIGMYLFKFANNGKGPLQKRYFWLDCFTGEMCWAKSPKHFAKAPELASSEYLKNVKPRARSVIQKRPDYKPDTTHKFAFTLCAHGRDLDLVAPNQTDFSIWIEGLRCLKIFGDHLLHVEASTSNSNNIKSSPNLSR